jgi:hypothetical protein
MKKFKIMITISLILFIITGYLYSITEKKTDLKTNIVIEESKEELENFEETIISDTETNSEKIEENKENVSSQKTNVVEKKVDSKKSSSTKNNTKTATPKVIKDTKKDNNTTLESSNKTETSPKSEVKEEKKEEVQPKTKEETSKTIEIVIEEPKEADYKNDPEYIKMKKELFFSKDECLKKGIDLSFSDSENIASTMCTSESYKGKEVGFRLYIRYKDGTYKEYKK